MEPINSSFDNISDISTFGTFSLDGCNMSVNKVAGAETICSTNVDETLRNGNNVSGMHEGSIPVQLHPAVTKTLSTTGVTNSPVKSNCIFKKVNKSPIEPKVVELPSVRPKQDCNSAVLHDDFNGKTVTCPGDEVQLNGGGLDLPVIRSGSSLTNSLDIMVSMMNQTFREIRLMSSSISELAQ